MISPRRNLYLCLAALLLTTASCQHPSASPPPPNLPSTSLPALTLDLNQNVSMKFVRIPAGTFLMGSPQEEKDVSADEITIANQHQVTLTHSFYMGICPVTQEQYEAVMDKNPSWFKGPTRPVEQVSWDDAAAFCKKLSAITGFSVRLPTEAQWEYACRAGTTTAFNTGPTINGLQANYGDLYVYGSADPIKNKHPIGPDQTSLVGTYPPNAWGLYDMHGNVWQYCSDYDRPADLPTKPTVDPTGPKRGEDHIIRGGCWAAAPWTCRSAYREGIPSGGRYSGGGGYFGFRVILADAATLPRSAPHK